MSKYVGNKEACEILGIHYKSLYNWDKSGKIETIRTPGGKRLYNITKFISKNSSQPIEINKEIKRNICYCRVSTQGQKEDLNRQIDYMKKEYPTYEIIKDIGSGLNFKRKGLQKIIKYATNGEINEIIIAYKDRLCRFGYELIEFIISTYSNGKIIILDKKNLSPEEELTKDLVSIINVFSARLNGLRSYKKHLQQTTTSQK